MRVMIWLVMLAIPSLAQAWDGELLWNNPANGQGPVGAPSSLMPGGGGIYGTGGARDYNITCASCHVNDKKQQGQIDAKLTFTPSLSSLGAAQAYKPGQLYVVTVALLNEKLGKQNCDQYVTGNINNFAASFEDSAGKSVGVLASDSGQSAAACSKVMPANVTTGTTMLYGDCHAITSMGGDKRNVNTTTWTFKWTAPAAGAGQVTIYWGVVDGDCVMDSLGDDVKVGTTKLVEGVALRSVPRVRWARTTSRHGGSHGSENRVGATRRAPTP